MVGSVCENEYVKPNFNSLQNIRVVHLHTNDACLIMNYMDIELYK